MKKHILIPAVLFALNANAQKLKETRVPANVLETFKKTHANVKEVEWEKEGENYEAEFETGKIEQSVLINAKGGIIETEVEIAITELPPAVTDYVAKNYNATKIKEAAKITDASGVITYETEVGKRDLLFDHTGRFIKEETDEVDERNEKD